MLPCNVIVQELRSGQTEIAAIDPRAAMERVGNPALAIAAEVADRLIGLVRLGFAGFRRTVGRHAVG
jgi:hypothetical protein